MKGYGSLIAAGYDTLVESFNLTPDHAFWDMLGEYKKLAQEGDIRGGDVRHVGLGVEKMEIQSYGGRKGTPYILKNPDFDIDLRSPKTEWNVTVRYSSVGLWQYGADVLRDRVRKALLTVFKERKDKSERWSQVSSVHFAFDFYSPKFTQEMNPEIFSKFICHSSSKKHVNFKLKNFVSAWGRAGYFETVTLGNKKNLEVQVYDKGKEIKEASGKEWMIKLWEREGYCPPKEKKLKDVWRLELRFGKEYLNNRNLKDFEDFDRQLEKICIEAIYTKRLTQDNGDSRIRRRPLHPLWRMAALAIGAPEKMLALGKVDTMAKKEKIAMLKKQSAGLDRNIMVLENDRADREDFIVFAEQKKKDIFMDSMHLDKVEKLKRRNFFKDQARG